MPEIFSLISAKWIPSLWNRLVEIRNKRENQIREITDSFGDPYMLVRYYIEPKCQHHNPADYNEVEAISFVKCPVFDTLNDFLNRDFSVNDGRNQMFVLGDAGMGKTSLLLVLKLTHLTAFWPQKFHCELLKLGPDTLKRVEHIADKRNTILLLDGLDEDPEGFGRVEERLLEVLSSTKNFRRVIISCRTQYFPSGGADPFDRPGRIEVGGFLCPMIFLSLFDDVQVQEYLLKRFSKDSEKVAKSKAVVEKMETLRFRPLLLAHIEDIVESQKQVWNEYTIYKALVEAWLLREETKFRHLDRGAVDAKSLWAACTAIALYMQANDKRLVPLGELDSLIQSIPEVKHLKHFDVGGRSLLNRDSKGNYRFSHYTTQEFLIAHAIASREIIAPNGRIRATDQIIHFLSAGNAQGLRVDRFDFTGCELTKLSLSNAEASGVILANVDLRGLDLSGANLSGADLRQANLEETNLRGANLNNARLNEANLTRTILDDANLSGADLSGSKLEACSLNRVTLNAQLSGASLISLKFQEIDFSGTNLTGCNLERQDLSGVNFKKADLRGTNFTHSNLSNAQLQEANLSNAILRHADLSQANLTKAILDYAILDGTDLRTAQLKDVDLSRVNLKVATIARRPVQDLFDSALTFKDLNLAEYDFRFADLSNVDLSSVDLTGKDFYGAILWRANLCGADLRDAINIENASFMGAFWSSETKFPETFSPYDAGMIKH